MFVCGLATVEVAVSGNNTVTDMHPLARRFLCGCMVLALLLSGMSVGLGLRTYAYVLEAKVTVFSCLSVGVRLSFFSSYAPATVVSMYVWVSVDATLRQGAHAPYCIAILHFSFPPFSHASYILHALLSSLLSFGRLPVPIN